VDLLENGKGMNLTEEVRDGIVNHTGENTAATLEGQVIKYADRIAYINHDIDDAIRGGIIKKESIPKHCLDILGETHSQRINTMITDIIQNSLGKNTIQMSEEIYKVTMELRGFMFDNVYIGSAAKKEEQKAQHIVAEIYNHFIKHPELMPEEFQAFLKHSDVHRVVCDYIAGMTDRYAIHIFYNLFIPSPWRSVYYV